MAGRMAQTLIVVLLLSIAVHSVRGATCDDADSIALSYFLLENPLGGPALNKWLPGTDCCTWPGITCTSTGKVSAINIVNPTGPTTAPPATSYQVASGLGALDKMTSLVMKNVSLNGNIPAAWGNLLQLQTLDVEKCSLIGTLPVELCNLAGVLQSLNFANNYLNGTIPSCVSNMTSTTMNLSGNQLSGLIPSATATPVVSTPVVSTPVVSTPPASVPSPVPAPSPTSG